MTPPDLAAPSGGPAPDVAAAELALGLLEGDDRAAALRRQLADPGFAREVERWRDHFATLFAGSAERVPPAALAERIESQFDRAEQRSVGVAAPAFWRPLALASMLAAASLSGVLLVRTETPSLVPSAVGPSSSAQMVAALALADGKTAPLAAYYDPAARMVRMPAPMPIPVGRSAQLWAIAPGQAPQPLGLFHVVGNSVVAEAKTKTAIPAGTMLAISFEPMGGSPTGQPTGPVVASGALSKV
ncbi:MAG: anti-sigma factor [Sphingomicrobium sp.]